LWFNAGDVTCLATVPFDMEVEAHFLAKEDGIIAGISLAEMIFHEVDPSLKVSMQSLCVSFIGVVCTVDHF
jgi:nicotinate-nucleotide pyrophosphorylase